MGGSGPLAELGDASALELGRLIRERQISSIEVLEQHLALIAERNPELNAIVTLCDDIAWTSARRSDERAAAGATQSPLDGVPITVKDVVATAGVRTTMGSLLFEDHVPDWTATAVTRLLHAGAVLLGKTNCPEFGLDPHTDNRLFGPTLNPLNPALTPGGSSGGESSAVASGCSALGIGTDYGGSVRWPAHCTGIAALRPTLGLVPATGLLPSNAALGPAAPSSVSLLGRVQTLGPMARSVADLWAALGVMAGPDGIDGQAVPVPLGDPAFVDAAQLACAWCDGEGSVEPAPDVRSAVADAASQLSHAGLARVDSARPHGLEEAESIYTRYRHADGLFLHQRLAAGREDGLTDTMREWFERVHSTSVEAYQSVAGERDALRASVLGFMEEYPILLLPVATEPPYEAGDADFDRRFRVLAPCRAVSLLGLPSVAVPIGRSPDGRPIAVQVVAQPFCDHEAIAVALLLQGDGRG
ncbi:MAG: amidase [Actinomycetia bacterium]|nr:amidase [Actinomycetes bacterium]